MQVGDLIVANGQFRDGMKIEIVSVEPMLPDWMHLGWLCRYFGWMKQPKSKGTAIISRVDPETQTIWLERGGCDGGIDG